MGIYRHGDREYARDFGGKPVPMFASGSRWAGSISPVALRTVVCYLIMNEMSMSWISRRKIIAAGVGGWPIVDLLFQHDSDSIMTDRHGNTAFMRAWILGIGTSRAD